MRNWSGRVCLGPNMPRWQWTSTTPTTPQFCPGTCPLYPSSLVTVPGHSKFSWGASWSQKFPLRPRGGIMGALLFSPACHRKPRGGGPGLRWFKRPARLMSGEQKKAATCSSAPNSLERRRVDPDIWVLLLYQLRLSDPRDYPMNPMKIFSMALFQVAVAYSNLS